MIINLNVLFFFFFFLLNNLNMLSWFIKDVLISNHIGCHKLSQQMELGSGKGSGHIFCSNLHLDVMSTMAQYSTLVMNNDMYSPQQELFFGPLGSSSLYRVRLSFSLDWVLALSLSAHVSAVRQRSHELFLATLPSVWAFFVWVSRTHFVGFQC